MSSIHKKKTKKYIHEPMKTKTGYFFCFLLEKTKKREYIFYQKCYEKYYGKPCDNSYKKFWRMMLRKSIIWWSILICVPILIILFIISIGDIDLPITDINKTKRTLTYEESKLIKDELEKQWAEEDKLEALKKENKEH